VATGAWKRGVRSVFQRKTVLTPMPTKVDTHQQRQKSVEGGVGPVAGCPRHGCRGQAPWTGLRRPRNRTHPAIPRNASS
jgi:hypothetical protein